MLTRTGVGVGRVTILLRRQLTDYLNRHADLVLPLPAVATTAALMILPIAYTIYLSFHSWYAASGAPPAFNGLSNYQELLQDHEFLNSIWHTVYFTVLALAVQVVLGVGAALIFNREFAGRGIARTLFLFPMMATPVAVALVWRVMYDPSLGVLTYLFSFGGPPVMWITDQNMVIPSLVIVDSWRNVPFVAIIVLAGLSVLPHEPYEAARIDGASSWQTFWSITLPLLRPAIVTAMLFRTIDTLKMFDIIFVITNGGPNNASETTNLFAYRTGFDYFQMGYVSAALVVLFLLVIGVSLALIQVRRASW